MIITGGKIVTRIHRKSQQELLLDSMGMNLLDLDTNLLYSNPPGLIAAIYKGKDLIWLTTYQVSVKSCYGSGVWLDNYNWIEDTWKN